MNGIWDFADGTTPFTARNFASLMGMTALDSGVGAILGRTSSQIGGLFGRGGLGGLAQNISAFLLDVGYGLLRNVTPADFWRGLLQGFVGSQIEFDRVPNRCR